MHPQGLTVSFFENLPRIVHKACNSKLLKLLVIWCINHVDIPKNAININIGIRI